MRVLLACEESQAVMKEFRLLGHEAFSCDLMPCSGGFPEYHIQGDVTKIINNKWDLIIAFPPCTFLTVTGNSWFNIEKYGDKARKRHKDRDIAAEFFMLFVNADCPRIAIENPIGTMSTRYRKPNQIIHPYYYGDPERKSTCLWLKGLPLLTHNKEDYVEPNIIKFKSGRTDSKWHVDTWKLPAKERSKARSKTFPGIAKAMASQWSDL
jgi:hypothetical protein